MSLGAVQVDLDGLLERILDVNVVDRRPQRIRGVRGLDVDRVRVGVHDREIRYRDVATRDGYDLAGRGRALSVQNHGFAVATLAAKAHAVRTELQDRAAERVRAIGEEQRVAGRR